MTRTEFGIIVAYLEVGCGKKLPTDAMEVFFDLLGDLPAAVLQLAAKRVILEHRWATFPSVAELREAAVLTARGEVKELSPAEGWELAWNAVKNIDPEIERSVTRAMEKLPPLVVAAIRAMGLLNLCYGEEPVAVIRGQFLKVFEQLAARDKRTELFPLATRQEIAAMPTHRTAITQRVVGILEGIGEGVK